MWLLIHFLTSIGNRDSGIDSGPTRSHQCVPPPTPRSHPRRPPRAPDRTCPPGRIPAASHGNKSTLLACFCSEFPRLLGERCGCVVWCLIPKGTRGRHGSSRQSGACPRAAHHRSGRRRPRLCGVRRSASSCAKAWRTWPGSSAPLWPWRAATMRAAERGGGERQAGASQRVSKGGAGHTPHASCLRGAPCCAKRRRRHRQHVEQGPRRCARWCVSRPSPPVCARTRLHQLPHKGLCDGPQREKQQRVGGLVAARERRDQLRGGALGVGAGGCWGGCPGNRACRAPRGPCCLRSKRL